MSNLQKTIKNCAIAFGVLLIVLAVVLVCSVLSLLFSSNNNTFNSVYENDITSLYVDVSNSNVTIVYGTEFSVDSQDVSSRFKVTNSGSSLKIKDSSSSLFGDPGNIVITVPKSINTLSIDVGRGTTTIEGIQASKFEGDFGSGDVSIISSSFTTTEIDGGTGDIFIEDGTLGRLELDLGVGDAIIDAIIDNGSEIETGVGNLTINLSDSIDNYSFSVDKGIGTISINGEKLSSETTYGTGYKKISIDGGVGSIEING